MGFLAEEGRDNPKGRERRWKASETTALNRRGVGHGRTKLALREPFDVSVKRPRAQSPFGELTGTRYGKSRPSVRHQTVRLDLPRGCRLLCRMFLQRPGQETRTDSPCRDGPHS